MRNKFAIAALIFFAIVFHTLSRPEVVIARTLKTSVKIECLATEKQKFAKPIWSGSGSFISGSGTILTNKHVVHGCTLLEVSDSEGDFLGLFYVKDVVEAGEVDLAIIKTRLEDKPYLLIGDEPTVGETVYVIGSPMGYDFSVTKGIVSSVSRAVGKMKLIQSDAAINHGNSGGAMIDSSGKLVGVPQSIITPSSNGGFIGLGFSVSPITVKEFLAEQII